MDVMEAHLGGFYGFRAVCAYLLDTWVRNWSFTAILAVGDPEGSSLMYRVPTGRLFVVLLALF